MRTCTILSGCRVLLKITRFVGCPGHLGLVSLSGAVVGPKLLHALFDFKILSINIKVDLISYTGFHSSTC